MKTIFALLFLTTTFQVFGEPAKSSLKLVSPANGASVADNEKVTFKWASSIPKEQGSITYRLKIWQLKEGQTDAVAMRVNQPIIIKDVDNTTQTLATGTGILTGPCKPPFMCVFTWNVQALNKDGKTVGENNGTSDGFRFSRSTEKK